LDPLNQHEVQIWKDSRGTVNFQLAYTLTTEWVRHFHGEHTEPQYHRLGTEELAAEGLAENDTAFRVSFLMKRDIPSLSALTEAYDARQARAMLEITGLGVAQVGEYTGKYFAPAGRSRAWKVKKRALTDAYRRKFGTPTRSEIEELRRAGGMANVRPQDWSDVQELNPGDAAALAKDTAMHREHQERLAEDPGYKADFDKTVKAAEELMYPAPEPQTVDAEFTEIEDDRDPPPGLTPELEEMRNEHIDAVNQNTADEPEPALDADPETCDAWDDEIIKEAKAIGGEIRKAAGWTINGGWHRAEADFIGDSQQSRMLAGVVSEALQGVSGVDKDKPHHVLIAWLFNADGGSVKNLTDREAGVAVARWTANGDMFTPTDAAAQEIRTLFQGAQLLSGQQRLPLD